MLIVRSTLAPMWGARSALPSQRLDEWAGTICCSNVWMHCVLLCLQCVSGCLVGWALSVLKSAGQSKVYMLPKIDRCSHQSVVTTLAREANNVWPKVWRAFVGLWSCLIMCDRCIDMFGHAQWQWCQRLHWQVADVVSCQRTFTGPNVCLCLVVLMSSCPAPDVVTFRMNVCKLLRLKDYVSYLLCCAGRMSVSFVYLLPATLMFLRVP